MVTIAVDKDFHLTSMTMGQDDTVEMVILILRKRVADGRLEPMPLPRKAFEAKIKRMASPNFHPSHMFSIPLDPDSEIFKMVYRLEG